MNEQQTIDFVLEVKKYPCLYNPHLTSYYRKTQTNKVWEKISKIMNMSAMACKEKWRNLRVVFVRHMKQSSIKSKRPYYLSDYMDFLLPYLKRQFSPKGENTPHIDDTTADTEAALKTSYAAEQTEIETNVEEDEDISTPEPKKRRLSSHQSERHFNDYPKLSQQYKAHTSTAVTPFLNSLVPELEEMNLQQFKIFKRQVLALIDEIIDNVPSSSRSHLSKPANTVIKQEFIVEHEYTDSEPQEDTKHIRNSMGAVSPSDDLNSATSSPSPFEEKHFE